MRKVRLHKHAAETVEIELELPGAISTDEEGSECLDLLRYQVISVFPVS